MTNNEVKIKFLELGNDFEVIKGIKASIPSESLELTMSNLQAYEVLKTRYLRALNVMHMRALEVLPKAQYCNLQCIIDTIKRQL